MSVDAIHRALLAMIARGDVAALAFYLRVARSGN